MGTCSSIVTSGSTSPLETVERNRQMPVTELAEPGAGDEVIMSIAGDVSRAMRSRYSHIRMKAKTRALTRSPQDSARLNRKLVTERALAGAPRVT